MSRFSCFYVEWDFYSPTCLHKNGTLNRWVIFKINVLLCSLLLFYSPYYIATEDLLQRFEYLPYLFSEKKDIPVRDFRKLSALFPQSKIGSTISKTLWPRSSWRWSSVLHHPSTKAFLNAYSPITSLTAGRANYFFPCLQKHGMKFPSPETFHITKRNQ